MKAEIVLLPGDGIGPEVIDQARLTLEQIAETFGHALTARAQAESLSRTNFRPPRLSATAIEAFLYSFSILLVQK